MAEFTYPLYDTARFGTTANTTHTLFQNGQGSNSGNDKTLTNMRGSGQLPDRESFTLRKIGIHIDDVGLSDDDIHGLFMSSVLTVYYNNVKILQIPAYMASDKNRVSGIKTESTASPFDYFGQDGDGFVLDIPRIIEGGKSFSVELFQALAMDSSNLSIKVVLYGDLSAPDISV